MHIATRIDHLVIGAASLEQGAAFIEQQLGVRTAAGGEHPLMGTHNRVLRLGERAYLEVIAIDPDAVSSRPRWFGLDSPEVQRRLRQRPRLLHWVAATGDIAAAAAACPRSPGEIIAMRRGTFSWRITVAPDGRPPLDGVLASLIQWDGEHPAERLAESGCFLHQLRLGHPDRQTLAAGLAAIGLAADPALRVESPGPISLVACIATPAGMRTLD